MTGGDTSEDGLAVEAAIASTLALLREASEAKAQLDKVRARIAKARRDFLARWLNIPYAVPPAVRRELKDAWSETDSANRRAQNAAVKCDRAITQLNFLLANLLHRDSAMPGAPH